MNQNIKSFIALDSILNLIYISIIFHLFKTYRNRMEPVHILEINTVVDQFIIIGSLALSHIIGSRLGDDSWVCKMISVVSFAARWSFYLGICWTQVDRFLTLYWNISYKERVTNNKALDLIIITKVLSLILSLIALLMDPAWFACQGETAYQCTVYKRNNALFFTFPMTLVFIIVLIVSSYSMRLILKTSFEISPVVNLNYAPRNCKPVNTISRTVETVQPGETHFQQSPNTTILDKSKVILVNNIFTLCILLMTVPNYVMNLIVYLEDKVCDKDLMMYGKIFGRISLISIICRPFFIVKKLSKF